MLKMPDIVFLDIEMPVMSGINLAREIAGAARKTEIVFVTAFDAYAVNAFEVNAVDYVLKPVSADRLDKTLERIREKRRGVAGTGRHILEKLNSFGQVYKAAGRKVRRMERRRNPPAQSVRHIACHSGKGAVSVVSNGGYTWARAESTCGRAGLKEYNFFRSHRGELVNMDYAEKIIPYENNCCAIILKKRQNEIPVSRNRTKELKKY